MSWMQTLGRNQKQIAYVLLALGVGLMALAVFLGWRYGKDWTGEIGTSAFVGLALAGLGFWSLQEPSAGEGGARDTTHVLVLGVTGLVGLGLFALSVWWGYSWWDIIAGGTEKWRGRDGLKVLAVIAAQLVGLALVFSGLAAARGTDPDDPTLRRLLYGYGAGLTGLLLFEILLVLNVLAFLRLPQPADWTSSKIYTLDEQSQKLLRGLEKPVKVTAVLSTRRDTERFPGFYQDVSTLLDNARGTAPSRFRYEEVLRHQQPVQMAELREKYFVDDDGLLVVYGDDKDAPHQFLKQDELYDTPPMTGRAAPRRPAFKGEDALMSAINFLSEGKAKATVYFTQGSGELDIGASNLGGLRPDQRAAELVRQLETSNYEVKGLFLGGGAREGNPKAVVADKVPDDAAAVVVAGPQRPLPGEAVEALRKYMTAPNANKKKGTLLVLAGAVESQGRMAPTGLEGLLAEYNVELGQGRLLSYALFQSQAPPEIMLAYPNRDSAGAGAVTTILGGESRRRPSQMVDVRSVQPRRDMGPAGGGYQAEELLRVPPDLGVWSEDNLGVDPVRMLTNIAGNREARKKLIERFSQTPVPIAVAVSEGKGPAMDPRDPHAFMNQQQGTPRLVVVGASSFASDVTVQRQGRTSEDAVRLVAGSLAWLRERPNSLNIAARTRKDYEMDADTGLGRMVFVPGALMSLSVIGLGLGVWITRRR